MIVKPSDILPSQDFLKPGTITYIFECIKNNEIEKLPPAPIVRNDKDGSLIAIDGHNLIAVMHELGRDIAVHIASSKNDGLIAIDTKDADRNKDLVEKYDAVLIMQKEVAAKGVKKFQDLINRYKELFV